MVEAVGIAIASYTLPGGGLKFRRLGGVVKGSPSKDRLEIV